MEKKKPSKANHKIQFLPSIALLISFIAVLGFGFVLWQQQQQQVTNSSQFSQLQQDLQQHQQQLAKQYYSANKWHKQAAYYLVQRANLMLHYGHQIVPTIMVLQAADDQLAQAAPQFNNLREQIAQAIAELNALPKLDTAKLLNQLTALNNQIKDLAIATVAPVPVTKTTATTPSSKWQQLRQTLQTIVVIRHHDKATTPLLSEQQKNDPQRQYANVSPASQMGTAVTAKPNLPHEPATINDLDKTLLPSQQ